MSDAVNWNAELYTNRHAFVWQSAGDLVDLLDPKPGERVLDVGCGTGQLTDAIAKRGATVVGIDSSPDMIAEAKKLYPHLQLEVGDARTFRFDQPFDALFSNATLHWVQDAERAADRIARTLRPGGRFVAEFGGDGNVAKVVEAMHRAANDLGRPFGSDVFPWYFPSIGEYTRVLERVGLEPTFATLFDRLTKLEGEEGYRNWVRMFGSMFLSQIPSTQHEKFFALAESHARPALYRENAWYADYRRLRIIARRLEK